MWPEGLVEIKDGSQVSGSSHGWTGVPWTDKEHRRVHLCGSEMSVTHPGRGV